MKNYIAIISNNGTKVTKFKDFDTETDAKVHVVKYGGFSAESVGERIEYYVVKDETISYDNDAIKEKEDNEVATAYISRRTNEYPSTGDQLDYIFHNGVAKWKTDMIEPVKTKWPKDNSGPVVEEEPEEEESED